jgi:hypothetical protein
MAPRRDAGDGATAGNGAERRATPITDNSEAAIMLQIFMLIAIAGTALLLPSQQAWASQGAPYAGSAVPAAPSVSAAEPAVTRCGPESDPAGADPNLAPAPLPNAYMTVNGRVFALGRAIACAVRLHTARYH